MPTKTAEDAETALPNKYSYAEFAGFAGEKLLKQILRKILPMALYRTWAIFAEHQAVENDCFLSLSRLAHEAERTPRTMRLNLAELEGKGLLVQRAERKVFRGQNGTTTTRIVVVKDFSGLYALAHEYYEWSWSAEFIEADRQYASLIKAEGLEAKLRRFNHYRRVLYTHIPGPDAHLSEECQWFNTYQAEFAQKGTKDAEVHKTDPLRKVYLSNNLPEKLSKDSQNESERMNQDNSRDGDSFDSDGSLELGEEAAPQLGACSQKRARGVQGYTKGGREHETGATKQNESVTNPVPSPTKDLPPCAGKTRESAETHQDVRQARQAMAAAGFAPGRSARRQGESVLPAPPKIPLVRSFVHEIAGIFSDLNEKGSKTGIERSIATFELEQPAQVLLCLVRAYVVARDTKAEKIRHQHSETGTPNRMPLFCAMFKTFARALASGSPWEYTWEKMLSDVEADDRLVLWMAEYQGELAGNVHEQVEAPVEEATQTVAEASGEQQEASTQPVGWSDRAEALEQGERLLQAIVDANYAGVLVKLRCEAEQWYVIYQVEGDPEHELVLAQEAEVASLIEMARTGTL